LTAPPPPIFEGTRGDDVAAAAATGAAAAVASAIPPSEMLVVPALCTTTTFALLLPVEVGLNSVSTTQLASTANGPAVQVVPAPSLKSTALVPPIATAMIVRAALPVFVRVAVRGGAEAPVVVDGKLSALAFRVAAPVGVVVPGPVSVITWGEPVAFDVIVRLPLRLPAAEGVNVTLMLQLAPAARLPTQLPVAENSGVGIAVTAVIDTLAVLLFVIVT